MRTVWDQQSRQSPPALLLRWERQLGHDLFIPLLVWEKKTPFTLPTLSVVLSTSTSVDDRLMHLIACLQLKTQERKEEQELRCASWSCRWSWSVSLLVTLFFWILYSWHEWKYLSAYDLRAVVRCNWMRFVPSPSMLFTCSLNWLLVYFRELFMLPEVVDVPIPESEHDELAKRHPGVFIAKVQHQYRPFSRPKMLIVWLTVCFCPGWG